MEVVAEQSGSLKCHLYGDPCYQGICQNDKWVTPVSTFVVKICSQAVGVERVAFPWDEYADKMAPDRKAGDYSASTFQGPPIIVPTPAPSDAMTPPNWTPTRPQAKAKASP